MGCANTKAKQVDYKDLDEEGMQKLLRFTAKDKNRVRAAITAYVRAHGEFDLHRVADAQLLAAQAIMRDQKGLIREATDMRVWCVLEEDIEREEYVFQVDVERWRPLVLKVRDPVLAFTDEQLPLTLGSGTIKKMSFRKEAEHDHPDIDGLQAMISTISTSMSKKTTTMSKSKSNGNAEVAPAGMTIVGGGCDELTKVASLDDVCAMISREPSLGGKRLKASGRTSRKGMGATTSLKVGKSDSTVVVRKATTLSPTSSIGLMYLGDMQMTPTGGMKYTERIVEALLVRVNV